MINDINNALTILKQGGIILYPTDTVWGIGCDATCEDAVERIYKIKKRHDSRSMLILLDSIHRLTQYAGTIPDVAFELNEVSVNPLTIIYPDAKNLAPNLPAEDNSIGIRIIHDEFCRKLIERLKKPLVSTSANISGKPAPPGFHNIDPEIKKAVDYIVEWRQNDLSAVSPSGIIKLGQNGEVQVIRE